jgi:hypothetical protein
MEMTMARPPIGERAMTPAERARRYRERHREERSVDRAASAARAALSDLWSAVLHAGPDVDATRPLRDEISAMQTAMWALPSRLRALKDGVS